MSPEPVDPSTTTALFVGPTRQGSTSSRSQKAEEDSVVEMRVLELLMARLCHELSAPIAAINNGVELLADEDPDFASAPAKSFSRDAALLIGESARRAVSRLQFYRFAYGFGRDNAIVGPAPHELVAGLFAASRIVCDYPGDVRILPLNWQKLACNLVSVGSETLPRGGRLTLIGAPLSLEATGATADLFPGTSAALTLTMPIAELTSRTVQAFFAGLLAKALGYRLTGTAEPGRVRITLLASAA
jgi:histidine phosphotransferase ChpT